MAHVVFTIFLILPSTFLLALPLGRTQSASRPLRSRCAVVQQATSEGYEECGCSDEQLYSTQQRQLRAALSRIEALQISVEQAKEATSLVPLEEDIGRLEEEVTALTISPVGLSSEEFSKAVQLYQGLPYSVRLGLCYALALENRERSLRIPDEGPAIVEKLYEERAQLTPERLQDASRQVTELFRSRAMSVVRSRVNKRNRNSNDGTTSDRRKTKIRSSLLSLFSEGNDDVGTDGPDSDATVEQLLGRVTRQEGRTANKEDLRTLMDALGRDTFVPSETEAIAGGYVVRGRNTKSSGEELIEAMDGKLSSGWSAQVSFLPDFTSRGVEAAMDEDAPVLVLLKRDLSPKASRWLLSLSTALAILTAFLFSVGVYGGNEFVMNRLTEPPGTSGDFSGISWFNGKVLEVLIPVGIIQALHEFGHLVVARKKKIKSAPPTLIPFWILPFMGAKTPIKESPKNLTALFDFAFLGPFLGISASLVFLLLGLQLTGTADPETAQYFPALPVNAIRLSTLGGAVIDNFLGGNGYGTLQDPATPIALHPYAVAGFTSLVMNALDMLPLGSTDGGRISMSLFGRQGNSIVGGTCWLIILLAALFSTHNDVLLGAFVVNNIIQNDQEVPCRNEVDEVDFGRALAALVLWFVAILALTPMS